MLDDLTVSFQPKNVHPGIVFIAGPVLETVQDHEFIFSNDPLELHSFTRILARHSLEIVHKALLACRDTRVVLNVFGADVLGNGLTWEALI